MTHIRTQKNKNYTVINNTIAIDKRLSWKAKGIFLYAMSRPDDWRFHVNDLINQGLDGRDSVRAGLKELEQAGYLKRSKVHGPDGKFSDDEWILYEEPIELKEKVPQTGFPAPAKPTTENPALENPPLLSTEEKLNTVVVSEKKFIDNGIEKTLTFSDISSYAVKFKPDWTYQEIQDAWYRFVNSKQLMDNPFDYFEGIIKNIRIRKQFKEKKCKKTTTIATMKKPSENVSKFYTEKDMSESPLALYARQNGLK